MFLKFTTVTVSLTGPLVLLTHRNFTACSSAPCKFGYLCAAHSENAWDTVKVAQTDNAAVFIPLPYCPFFFHDSVSVLQERRCG